MKIRVENQRKKLKVQNPGRHFLLFSFLLSIIFTSCEKDPTEFGSDLLPGQDSVAIQYEEIYNLATFLEPSDTFNTSTYGVPIIIGNISDPNFGHINASFAAELGLYNFNISFGNDPVIDSVKLSIRVDSIYGYKDDNLNLLVYKLNQELGENLTSVDKPDEYYSSADLISEETRNIQDSIYEVRLSNSFGNYLLSLDSATLSNDTSFLNEFPGIFCKSVNVSGTGGQLAITNQAYLGINLYYHTQTDTFETRFPFRRGFTKNNFFSQDFGRGVTESENAQKYLTNPEGETDSLLFIRGLNGTRGRVKLPNNLDSLIRNKLIAKATIEFTNRNEHNIMRVDSSFAVFKYDNGSYLRISSTGGLNKDNKFTANVTEYIQNLAKGQDTTKNIYVNTPTFFRLPGQMVLGGVNSATPPKLKIRYYDNPPE